MTQSDPLPQPVLPYAAKPSTLPRVKVLAMTGACVAGGVATIFILVASQGVLFLVLRPQNLMFLLVNISTIAAGFLPAVFLFRPLVHPRRWPPYALSAGAERLWSSPGERSIS